MMTRRVSALRTPARVAVVAAALAFGLLALPASVSAATGSDVPPASIDEVGRDSNRPPVFDEWTSEVRIDEHTPLGTTFAPFWASDPDGQTVYVRLSRTDLPFGFDYPNPRLRLISRLDFEKRDRYEFELIAEDYAGGVARQPMTVVVVNNDDPGKAEVSPSRPWSGYEIRASVTDPDGSVHDVTWTWNRGPTPDGPFEPIAGANEATYEPTSHDEGLYLRAIATYADGHGPDKEAWDTSRSEVFGGGCGTARRAVADC